MTERKPHNEKWESFTERLIREAQANGAFDNLPGQGRPIPGIDGPQDENWWLKQTLKREELNLLPPVLEARLRKERTLDEISRLQSEAEVRRRLEELNEFIREAQRSPVPGPPVSVWPVDVEAIVARWRERRARQE